MVCAWLKFMLQRVHLAAVAVKLCHTTDVMLILQA